MKKAIPVIVAIVLIIIIAIVSFGKPVYEKYSYGQERADLNEYFQIFGADDVPIILQDEHSECSGKLINGNLYFDMETVANLFVDRFYYDANENLLLYTSPTTTYETMPDSSSYRDIRTGEERSVGTPTCIIKNDELYIAADYVKKFFFFTYEMFDDPHRALVYTEWNEKTVATIKSDTQVRWRGGVKSEILTDVKEGDKVIILEVMDDWTKVETEDAFIGYVENFRLKDETKEIPSVNSDVLPEQFNYLTKDYKINLTWHNIEYEMGGNELINAMQTVKEVNVVSPTSLWLCDNDGNIKNVGTASYVEAAHNMGMEVWSLVSNFHSDTDVTIKEVLSYTSKRRYLIQNLIDAVTSVGADGINVDFENVPSDTAEDYIQFIRELALACHENNLVISVDNYVPTEYTAHYHRKEQGKFVDYLIIMGYDEHYKGGSEAGSVSSVPWMQAGIEDTVALVGKEKVINAIPFYTRVWKSSNGTVDSEAVEMKVANEFISSNGIQTVWDESTYQNYGEATIGGVFYQVWMEDADSVKVRLNVMQASDIAGIASWKLGQETPDIWDLIAAYMAQ